MKKVVLSICCAAGFIIGSFGQTKTGQTTYIIYELPVESIIESNGLYIVGHPDPDNRSIEKQDYVADDSRIAGLMKYFKHHPKHWIDCSVTISCAVTNGVRDSTWKLVTVNYPDYAKQNAHH